MRVFFRTRSQKRVANRRVACWLFASASVVTLVYGAALVVAYLLGWF